MDNLTPTPYAAGRLAGLAAFDADDATAVRLYDPPVAFYTEYTQGWRDGLAEAEAAAAELEG